MDLSVIIVSWNVKELLKANLTALFKSQGDFSFEVFVVDNASRDGSAEMLRQNFSAVKLIANETNRGFAAANNQALAQANGDFLLLLNPDMILEAETLAKFLNWAKVNPQATVAGCKLIDGCGRLVKQVRRFPKFCDQLLIILKIPHIFPFLLGRYLQRRFNYEDPARVDSLRGSCFLINRRQYEKISGERPCLDEGYFLWFEEVDFCRRVYSLGGEVWYTPAARARDYFGRSFAQVKRGAAQKYFRDSMLKYFQKWGRPGQVRILRAAWALVGIFIK